MSNTALIGRLTRDPEIPEGTVFRTQMGKTEAEIRKKALRYANWQTANTLRQMGMLQSNCGQLDLVKR